MWVKLVTIGGISSLSLGVLACSASSGTPDERSTAGRVTQADTSSQVVVSGRSLSNDFLDTTFLPAGVAAGQKVIFIGDPLEARVLAFSRATGRQIGELPQPPGGFILPFIMHAAGEGKVRVLDAGGLPQPKPLVLAHPLISEYSYSFSVTSGFSANLTRFVDSTGTDVGFPEDFVQLDDGRLLLTDAVLGSIWVIQTDGTYKPGIVPKTFDPADGIPSMELCPTMPEVTVNGYPFLFSGSTNPGVEAIAVRNGTVYFSSPCARGVYSFPLAILDDNRQPNERAADIRLVSPTPSNIQVEELLDFQFNPFDPSDPYLYAAHGMQLEITRIDSRNGQRQVVAQDARLFDFPSSLAFLPPLTQSDGLTNLVVVSNQQERTPITNDAVTEDSFVIPFEVAKVHVVR